MNFIRLQGLAAGTVSGRNNGWPRCYVEFPIRVKTGFSYIELFFKVGSKSSKFLQPFSGFFNFVQISNLCRAINFCHRIMLTIYEKTFIFNEKYDALKFK